MSLCKKELKNITLPRFCEFPTFELYIDQVLSFVCERLSAFQLGDEPIITQAMINNYVKNGVLHPPVKKKYDRTHLAKLIVICISKRMLPLSYISDAIAVMSRGYDIEEGYNVFCDEVEYEIKCAVSPDEFPPRAENGENTHKAIILRSLASSVARILVLDRLIEQRRRLALVAKGIGKSH
jgi:hypothetical protein